MTIKLALASLLLAVLAGCASTPPKETSVALQTAAATVASAAANPRVHTYAAVDLEKAKNHLDQASTIWQTTHDPALTDHLAYMATQRAKIAEAVAATKNAQAQAEAANEKRKNLQLNQKSQKVNAQNQQINELKSQLASLKPRQTDQGIVLTLGNVLFATNSATLKPQTQKPLNKLGTVLRAHPDRRVRIQGYTDNTGTKAYNQQLSQQRAQSVASALIQRGIDPARLTVIGYGEANPIASNATEYGRQQNRRVNLIILNSGTRSGADPTSTQQPATSGPTPPSRTTAAVGR